MKANDSNDEAVDCVPIYVSCEQMFLWNITKIEEFRKKHRIVGTFVGSLPGFAHQNTQLGLPLQLLSEEAKILVENGLCKLVAIESMNEDTCDVKAVALNFEKQRKRTVEDYQRVLKEERLVELRNKAQLIGEGKKKCRRRQIKDNDELASSASVDEVVEAEVNRLPEVNTNLFPVQLFTRCFWKRRLKIVTHQWSYPETTKESLKYKVYKDLWNKGYYVTSGFKFGCDYLVYDGDPCVCHSKYMIVCKQLGENISSIHLMIFGRLSGQVNKEVLIASVNDEGDVSYSSLIVEKIYS